MVQEGRVSVHLTRPPLGQLSKEPFISSDLAESFTIIDDFDKRINAKKIKVVEKETLIWIYATLKEKMEISI